MFLCFAVLLICAGLSLLSFLSCFVPHNSKQSISYLVGTCWKCVLTVYCTYRRCSVQYTQHVAEQPLTSVNHSDNTVDQWFTTCLAFRPLKMKLCLFVTHYYRLHVLMSCELCSQWVILAFKIGWFSLFLSKKGGKETSGTLSQLLFLHLFTVFKSTQPSSGLRRSVSLNTPLIPSTLIHTENLQLQVKLLYFHF